MGTTEGVSNINTWKWNHISKVVRVRLLFIRKSALHFDVFPPIAFWYLRILVMSTYFWCKLLHFCVMYVLYVLLIYASIVCLWCIFFSTNTIWSDVEPTGYWWLEFWNISFGTSIRQSEVESMGSCRVYFGPPGSWLVLGLFSLSLLLIHPRRGVKLRLLLYMWGYLCIMDVWWLGGWCLVK